jgi:hypothetical protein
MQDFFCFFDLGFLAFHFLQHYNQRFFFLSIFQVCGLAIINKKNVAILLWKKRNMSPYLDMSLHRLPELARIVKFCTVLLHCLYWVFLVATMWKFARKENTGYMLKLKYVEIHANGWIDINSEQCSNLAHCMI